jgi:uncharacterized protein YyaL (SSP411 family)
MQNQARLHCISKTHLLCVAICVGAGLLNDRLPQLSRIQAQDKTSDAPQENHPYTNQLINESSPYLLQHAHNPVDWHPWGAEAFAKAKQENKPIFLSIGYSTCYWCHVMEVESFENPEVAAIINEHFVAIKVDREERPDIDEQYMIATQLLTQRGGWPNSVWLTPDGKPWMAGTYFPKPQFISVLNQLNVLWNTRRADIDKQADEVAEAAKRISEPSFASGAQLTPALIEKGIQQIVGRFDSTHAGFGKAPKFPPHAEFRLLVQQLHNNADTRLLTPLTQTLDAMWRGGIHDHLGGGFHRYSTDERWLLPHFEKMLYDNAQLMRAYADAFAITGETRYRDAVEDIHTWVQREMASPQGAFYSALDSGEVGEEGEAYVWTMDRLRSALGSEELKIFTEIYHIEPDGNFAEEATGKRTGANIPHRTQTFEAIAEQRGTSLATLTSQLAAIREKLLIERQVRPQPRRDDKVLAAWNGLMIGSLAHAGRLLNEPRYVESAEQAATFILNNMVRDGKLLRTFRDGQAKLPGYLDDYAYFTQGLVELYRATGEEQWLEQAKHFASDMLQGFEDQKSGGFFFTTNDHEKLLLRSKHLGGGGNVPNPNGVAAQTLIELFELTSDEAYRTAARRALQSLAEMMERQPQASEDLLVATALLLASGDKNAVALSPATELDSSQNATVQRVGPVTISITPSKTMLTESENFTVTIAMLIDDGWHLYGENPDASFLQPSGVAVEENDRLTIGEIEPPKAKRKLDPVLNQTLNTYTDRVEFKVPATVNAGTAAGETILSIAVTTQACDESRCLPPQTTTLRLPINIVERAKP